MRLPKSISDLIDHFERLPGIGPKTAQRLVFYLLHFPKEELQKFGDDLPKLKTHTQICTTCRNVGESDLCFICSDDARDRTTIAVVSSPLDVFALEKANFKGLYHVLHGVIDPLNNIGPDEIFINDLISRLKTMISDGVAGFDNATKPVEVVLATNTTMEGESTAMYISKLIRDSNLPEDQVKITRIARGLPVGGDIEYADATTLLRALEGRGVF